MNEDKKWMLMTYYCPIHGDGSKIEPLELTREEINRAIYKEVNTNKES